MAKAGKVPDDLDEGDGAEDGDLDALEEHRGGELLKMFAGTREASQRGKVFQRVFPGRGRARPRGCPVACWGCSDTVIMKRVDNLSADRQLDFDWSRKKRRLRRRGHECGGCFPVTASLGFNLFGR